MLQDAGERGDLVFDDFAGLEGCNEILNATRPDVVAGIHRAYFAAGADAVETNTFGANLPNLADYGIADRIRELAEKGARIAREVADEMSRPRTGRGSSSAPSDPGTKLPTLGHESYVRLRDAYTECGRGLIAGGSDALVVETCQDLLQVKAAVLGLQRAMRRRGPAHPDRHPRDRRDHRHDAAGQRDRRGADGDRAAGRRPDRAQLRHRPRGDERAPAHAGQARADPAVGDAERRAAGAGPARRGVPAHAGRAGRGARRVRPRLRAAAGRRLLRHDPGARPRGRRRRSRRSPPRRRHPRPEPGRQLALRRRAVPPGHLGAHGRRADQRQRRRRPSARPCSPSDWEDCVAHGPRADPRRRAPDRPQRRLRRAATAPRTWRSWPAGWPPRPPCRSCSTPPSRTCCAPGWSASAAARSSTR